MNKKLMSFVLAMVLSVGLGVSSVFATAHSYSSYGKTFSSFYSGKTGTASVTIKIGSEEDNLKGNLTGVFGYVAGVMVTYTEAGGKITVNDSLGARASVSTQGDVFTLTGFNFRSSDYANMPNLEDFLGPEGYRTQDGWVDENGKKITEEQYKKLKDEEKAEYAANYKWISKEDYAKLSDSEKAKYEKSFKTETTFETFYRKITYVKEDKDGNVTKELTQEEYDKLSEDAKKDYKAKSKSIEQAEYDKLSKKEKAKYTKVTMATEHYVFKSEEAKQAYVAAMTQYLLDIGFTKEQLTAAVTDRDGNLLDKDGNPIKYKDGDSAGFDGELATQGLSADWCVMLASQLKMGINGAASVSIGSGVTGPTLSLIEDGKTQLVMGMDLYTGAAVPTTRYVYKDGVMVGVQTATFEVDKVAGGFAQGSWSFNYTQISYDEHGVRSDKTYQFSQWLDIDNPNFDLEDTLAKAVPAPNENSENDPVVASIYLVSETHYYNNNTTNYVLDYKKSEVTTYANNRQTYVFDVSDYRGDNGDGTFSDSFYSLMDSGRAVQTLEKKIVGFYDYSDNGIIQNYWTANGYDQAGNDKKGNTTVYDEKGRALFTAVCGDRHEIIGDPSYRNELMQEYYDAITGSSYYKDTNTVFSKDTKITGFYIYANYGKDVKGGTVNVNFAKLGYTTNDVINMFTFNNGSAALAYTTIGIGDWEDDDPAGVVTDGADDQGTVQTRTSMGSHKQNSTRSVTRSYKGKITYNNTIFIGGAQAYTKECKIATSYQNVEWIESDPAVTGEVASIDDIEVTDEELEEAGIDPKDEDAVKEYKVKKLAEKMGIKFSREDYATEEEYQAAVDALAEGFYIDGEGNTFVVLKSSQVNLMDGSGFQPTAGETILVEIEAGDVQKIKDSIASDRTVMFMGDVRPDANDGVDGKGVLTMAMNKDYKTSKGAGVVFGDDVDDAMTEIDGISMDVLSAAKELGIDMSQFAGMKLEDLKKSEEFKAACAAICEKLGVDDDSAWIVENTLANGGVAFAGQDTQEGGRTNLEEAWRILLQF